ncbi:pyridoxal-phosphate dependent enzyme [Kitasatospora xanthocidica]|uniref:Pyridoxal-phosphate dependent enzyme n=1 Tax=Kitasatospora xanthocidica TaxID=83382 RepID=A0A372ZSY7_9ACTN|nr:pyridoxal-phosphate dependent enzyme [Kitasatospora xanthocidica]RGD58572.1 pyridoxal-phosphate dependent enzyme [Kitasatospora xanthocidica]
MAAVHESVLDAIGGTPLIRLARLGAGIAAPIYAKAEFLNIGGSVKDRAALSMVLAAERDGLLKPGGTIIEATSGNTGIGLAIVGRQRGYRVIAGVADKSSAEKSDILRAYGAEVVLAPTAVPAEDPRHLFNVVQRLAEEIPGAWLANQYDNLANPDAHIRTTGPEIWEQTGGRVTHFVAGVGTGGTITGTGGFLKETSGGAVTVVGADPESSTYGGGDGSPWYVESIGHYLHPDTVEDRMPQALRTELIDSYERIPDREALLAARRLSREEGLLAGPSSGAAVAAALRVARRLGPDDLVVVVLPDSGRSYLSKVHSDAWMREWGFLEEAADGLRPLLDAAAPLVTVAADATVGEALEALGDAPGGVAPAVLARAARPYGVAATEVVGSVSRAALAAALADGAAKPGDPLGGLIGPALPTVGVGQSAADARTVLGKTHRAVMVLVDGRVAGVLPREAVA